MNIERLPVLVIALATFALPSCGSLDTTAQGAQEPVAREVSARRAAAESLEMLDILVDANPVMMRELRDGRRPARVSTVSVHLSDMVVDADPAALRGKSTKVSPSTAKKSLADDLVDADPVKLRRR